MGISRLRARELLSRYLLWLWSTSVRLNLENIIAAARELRCGPAMRVCDLGAGDGTVTKQIIDGLGLESASIVECDDACARAAAQRGFDVRLESLDARTSFADDTFDVVLSNQVIEHLYDTEAFLIEATRILKPGGRLIVSTENPASWHNVAALVLGWQPFSLSNISSRRSKIGNPLSLAPSQDGWPFPLQHHRLFTPKALEELFELCGLVAIETSGAGYHPLPPWIGRHERTHAHFITTVGTKP